MPSATTVQVIIRALLSGTELSFVTAGCASKPNRNHRKSQAVCGRFVVSLHAASLKGSAWLTGKSEVILQGPAHIRGREIRDECTPRRFPRRQCIVIARRPCSNSSMRLPDIGQNQGVFVELLVQSWSVPDCQIRTEDVPPPSESVLRLRARLLLTYSVLPLDSAPSQMSAPRTRGPNRN
jgi:hypothetical protein